MEKTWVLIAQGSKAKILSVEGRGKNIISIKTFSHALTASKASEIYEDRPGRTFKRKGPMRSSLDFTEEPKDHERKLFAHELASFLAKSLEDQALDKLIVVASKDLLGQIRNALSPNLKKIVAHELDKDLMSQNLKDHELLEKIAEDLSLPHL